MDASSQATDIQALNDITNTDGAGKPSGRGLPQSLVNKQVSEW